MFFIYALLTTGIESIHHYSDWRDLAMLAIVSTVLSDYFLILAIKRIGSTMTSILGSMEPLTAVVVGVVQPIDCQLLIDLGEQLAQIVLFVEIQIVQVGAAVQLLPHEIDLHHQFGELVGLGQGGVFQDVAVIGVTLVQGVMQTEEVHFFHIQMALITQLTFPQE